MAWKIWKLIKSWRSTLISSTYCAHSTWQGFSKGRHVWECLPSCSKESLLHDLELFPTALPVLDMASLALFFYWIFFVLRPLLCRDNLWLWCMIFIFMGFSSLLNRLSLRRDPISPWKLLGWAAGHRSGHALDLSSHRSSSLLKRIASKVPLPLPSLSEKWNCKQDKLSSFIRYHDFQMDISSISR